MNYPELNIFKEFRQVIVWGFPLHTHTHSYIHGAWVKTFQYLGIKVHWFHDKEYPKDFDYSNTCFITEGWADDNIPVNSSSTYFVHIAKNPSKYLSLGARLIEIRYNVLEIHDFNYDYKLPDNPVYLSRDTLYERLSDDSAVASRRGRPVSSTPYEAVYMYWATDLLPHEFNYNDAENIVNTNIIHYIGSIGENHPFTQFKRIGEHLGFNVVHHNPWSNPISYDDNIKLMKESYCVPDFRSYGDASKRVEYGKMNGTNHLDIGYMPCRVLKAISYGRTGITNSKRVKDILGEFVEYAETPADVFEINERTKANVEWRKRCMTHVAENHTFLQRVRDLARALQMKSYQTTCVSAMYDIGREKIDGRKISDYKNWLFTTLKTIRDPFVLYLDSSLGWRREIINERANVGPIYIIETPLSEIPYWKYRDQVSTTLKNAEFKKSQKYPNDITNLLPEYCLVQYSKFDWIANISDINPFNSKNYVWIDAGYSRLYNPHYSYIFKDYEITHFTVQADSTISRIPSLTYDTYIGTNERIIQGGLWYASKSSIGEIRNLVKYIWENEMLAKSRIDNEQITLALVYKLSSDLFHIIPSKEETQSLFTSYFEPVSQP
jgi:hypothetical protein